MVKARIKKIFIEEGLTIEGYKLLSVSKTGLTYTYEKTGKRIAISVNSGKLFFSEIVALTNLEERLIEALANIRIKIKEKRSNFLGSSNIDSFKLSVEGMTDEEIQQEITNTTSTDLLVEDKNSIHRKRL